MPKGRIYFRRQEKLVFFLILWWFNGLCYFDFFFDLERGASTAESHGVKHRIDGSRGNARVLRKVQKKLNFSEISRAGMRWARRWLAWRDE